MFKLSPKYDQSLTILLCPSCCSIAIAVACRPGAPAFPSRSPAQEALIPTLSPTPCRSWMAITCTPLSSK